MKCRHYKCVVFLVLVSNNAPGPLTFISASREASARHTPVVIMIDITGHSSKKPSERKLQEVASAVKTVFFCRPHKCGGCAGGGRSVCITSFGPTAVERIK